ncbi:hypothetical protein TNCV_4412341 [Trichonephila clavipes]|nr:hypothetical protein TNCV_4412341 [Trichonephila clavipes]
MTLASNCVLTIIESVSGDTQGNVPLLLSLFHTTQALNQELWPGVPFLLTARPLWVIIRGTLTAQRCVDDNLRTVFLLQYLGLIFQNIRPDHMQHVLLFTVLQLIKHFLGQPYHQISLQ